jgi:hypothetical protein
MHLWHVGDEKPKRMVECFEAATRSALRDVMFMCPALRMGMILSAKAGDEPRGGKFSVIWIFDSVMVFALTVGAVPAVPAEVAVAHEITAGAVPRAVIEAQGSIG